MGKGDTRRPARVDDKTLEDNWARVFGSARPPRTPPSGNTAETEGE